MKYTTEEEKKKVRNAFKVFLAQNDLNLKTFCEQHSEVYDTVYSRLNRNQIDHNLIESLAKKVNSTAKLEKWNETFVFTFKMEIVDLRKDIKEANKNGKQVVINSKDLKWQSLKEK